MTKDQQPSQGHAIAMLNRRRLDAEILGGLTEICIEEIDEILAALHSTSEGRVEQMREALKPFADCCEFIDENEDDDEWAKFRLVIKNYRDARDALRPTSPTSVGEKE